MRPKLLKIFTSGTECALSKFARAGLEAALQKDLGSLVDTEWNRSQQHAAEAKVANSLLGYARKHQQQVEQGKSSPLLKCWQDICSARSSSGLPSTKEMWMYWSKVKEPQRCLRASLTGEETERAGTV